MRQLSGGASDYDARKGQESLAKSMNLQVRANDGGSDTDRKASGNTSSADTKLASVKERLSSMYKDEQVSICYTTRHDQINIFKTHGNIILFNRIRRPVALSKW